MTDRNFTRREDDTVWDRDARAAMTAIIRQLPTMLSADLKMVAEKSAFLADTLAKLRPEQKTEFGKKTF